MMFGIMLNEIPHESSQLNEMRNVCAIPCPKLFVWLFSNFFFYFGMPVNSNQQANTQKKIMSYMKESQLEIVGPNR